MSVIITGNLVYNNGKTSVLLTEADGPQTFSKKLEAQLVSEGAAKYIGKKPSQENKSSKDKIPPADDLTLVDEDDLTPADEDDLTPADDDKTQKPVGNDMPDNEKDLKGENKPSRIPEYNADMKLDSLREIMDDCQLTYKVGMSKVDVVALLDEYFDDEAEDTEEPPDLAAEEPVI